MFYFFTGSVRLKLNDTTMEGMREKTVSEIAGMEDMREKSVSEVARWIGFLFDGTVAKAFEGKLKI